MTKTCETCRFADVPPVGEPIVCRRYAPRLRERAECLRWPIVLKGDWCGEWEENPEREKRIAHAINKANEAYYAQKRGVGGGAFKVSLAFCPDCSQPIDEPHLKGCEAAPHDPFRGNHDD